MCGILAIVGARPSNTDAVRSRVRRMGGWQSHRGPDAWGEWTSGPVGLGHNRLSIIDLETGAQPMASADGVVCVTFNGEIYNHGSLRAQLQDRGHRFLTHHSDTEVIVNGYLEWGTGVFERLEGMFAIALWDEASNRLVVARDRLGIKPLYYAREADGTLLVSSEPKALLAEVDRRELRASALVEYFQFRAAIGTETLVEGVHRLRAATFAVFEPSRGFTEHQRYWQPDGTVGSFADEREAEMEVEAAIDRAVRSHLAADVPVGIFLSGGVDSSLIAACAARHGTVDAFTVATEGELDERPHAIAVADHLGMRLHTRVVTAADFVRQLDAWIYFNDDPVGDPSALALMLLAEHAHDAGMKVMLAGEGADEIFGGYNAYRRAAFFGRVARQPEAALVLRQLTPRLRGRNVDYASVLPDVRFFGTTHALTASAAGDLLGDEARARISAMTDVGLLRNRWCADPVRRAMLFDQLVRLPDDILARTDRATMAFSLETRVPFLDREVVELANSLPSQWCVQLRPHGSKRLLKRICARHVPRKVVYRRKAGFDLPIFEWLNGELGASFDDYLAEAAVPTLGYDFLRIQVDALRAGDRSTVALLWHWLVLERWYRTWIIADGTVRTPRRSLQGSPAV